MTLNTLILILYTLLLSVLFVFGSHGYVMVYLYRKRARDPDPPAPPLTNPVPFVTIQLPIYNEQYVVTRLLAACAAIDYPRDRFEIQILDDSTDETLAMTLELAERYRREGIHVAHVHREDRTGYKSGALRHGLESAKGEFIAIFDADFCPSPDFLRHLMPHFSNPKVGMVQARWGHLNDRYSLLTRLQAIGLDGHLVVEQTARHRNGYFINFNGTAGMWRKATILDAGNWQDDTLTEDLDLSYRAQLRGWKFTFLRDFVAPAELPSTMNALKTQQFRWTKGAIEVSRKILPMLWRSPIPFRVRLQGTIHLTNNFVFPCILGVALLNLPLTLVREQGGGENPLFLLLAVFTFGFFGSFVFYLQSQISIYPDGWRRMLYFPLFMAGSMGFSINNTRAVIEGLLKIKSPFVRTPKFHIVGAADQWRGKKYTSRPTGMIVLECFLALYCMVGLILAVMFGQYSAVPFHAMFVFGFSTVAFFTLKHHFVKSSTAVAPTP